jgi:ribosome maturation protein Sdo1
MERKNILNQKIINENIFNHNIDNRHPRSSSSNALDKTKVTLVTLKSIKFVLQKSQEKCFA